MQIFLTARLIEHLLPGRRANSSIRGPKAEGPSYKHRARPAEPSIMLVVSPPSDIP